MRQIFKNKFIKAYVFNSYEESLTFKNNQSPDKFLVLDNSFGDKYFYYVCFDSLTREKLFYISFCSDMSEDELIFFSWHESKLIVVDTGKEIYLIDNELRIVTSFDITSPLIGLHLTNENKLLILEEASLRLIDFEGTILMSCLFDLVEEFNIKENVLSIKTAEERRSFEL
ncbi:MAG: hypothetical protein J0H74_36890 [Chitinophagaceae bacterium]|nr:hypothetical protein [Chitinophagaceae bacterium]